MKKHIKIIIVFLVLLFANSVFAACLASVNMGGSRIKNLKTFNYDDTTAANYAATRDYVDGLMTPIKVYWQGGDPLTNTFDTFGFATFSASATDSISYLSTIPSGETYGHLPSRLITNCPYDATTFSMKCNAANSIPLMYDISGIKYKKNFSFKFDYKFDVNPTTADVIRIYLKSSIIPTTFSTTTSTGGMIVTLDIYNGKQNLYYGQSISNYGNSSGIVAGGTIQPPNIANVAYDTKWHTVQVDFIHTIKGDNSGGTTNLPAENIASYIVSIWIDSWNIRNYRVPLTNLAIYDESGTSTTTIPGVGSLVGVTFGGPSVFYLRNFVVDSGMMPIGN